MSKILRLNTPKRPCRRNTLEENPIPIQGRGMGCGSNLPGPGGSAPIEGECTCQMIAITPVTMKRLLNYERVAENEMHAANKRQWIQMTLENMRRSEACRRKAAHIAAIVAYGGLLFRFQNGMTPCRVLHDDGLLHNGLVELMHTLRIPVNMVEVNQKP